MKTISKLLFASISLFIISSGVLGQQNDNQYKIVDTIINDETPVKRVKITQTDSIANQLSGTIWIGFHSASLKKQLSNSLTEYFYRYFSGVDLRIYEIKNVSYTQVIKFNMGFDHYLDYDDQTSLYFGSEVIQLCADCPRIDLPGNIDLQKLENSVSPENIIFVDLSVSGEADYYRSVWRWRGFKSGFYTEHLGRRHFLAGNIKAKLFVYPTSQTVDSIRVATVIWHSFINQRYYKGNYLLFDKTFSINEMATVFGFDFIPRKNLSTNERFHLKNIRFSSHNNMVPHDFNQRGILLMDYWYDIN